jgi:hypothetical protein
MKENVLFLPEIEIFIFIRFEDFSASLLLPLLLPLYSSNRYKHKSTQYTLAVSINPNHIHIWKWKRHISHGKPQKVIKKFLVLCRLWLETLLDEMKRDLFSPAPSSGGEFSLWDTINAVCWGACGVPAHMCVSKNESNAWIGRKRAKNSWNTIKKITSKGCH